MDQDACMQSPGLQKILAYLLRSACLRGRMLAASIWCCSLVTTSALAGVAVSIEGGRGESVDIVGLGVAWTEMYRWSLPWHTQLNLSLLGRVDEWHGTQANAVVSDLWDVSATPVLTLQPAKPQGWFPYLDVGLGVHFISETRINATKQFSTVFQFGEFFGVGVRFGKRAKYDLGFRAQ